MFAAYEVDDCEVITITTDKWKDESSRTIVPEKCRIDERTRQIRDKKGDITIASGSVSFRGDYSIDEDALIKYNNVEHIILKIRKHKAFVVEYTECFIA